MGWLFTILLVAAAIVWIVKRGGFEGSAPAGRGSIGDLSVASVVFEEGKVMESRGRMPRHAYDAFVDIAAMAGMNGTVSVRPDGQIAFSPEVPDGARQQCRNAWHASRGR